MTEIVYDASSQAASVSGSGAAGDGHHQEHGQPRGQRRRGRKTFLEIKFFDNFFNIFLDFPTFCNIMILFPPSHPSFTVQLLGTFCSSFPALWYNVIF